MQWTICHLNKATTSAGGIALPISRVATTRPAGKWKWLGPWIRASSRGRRKRGGRWPRRHQLRPSNPLARRVAAPIPLTITPPRPQSQPQQQPQQMATRTCIGVRCDGDVPTRPGNGQGRQQALPWLPRHISCVPGARLPQKCATLGQPRAAVPAADVLHLPAVGRCQPLPTAADLITAPAAAPAPAPASAPVSDAKAHKRRQTHTHPVPSHFPSHISLTAPTLSPPHPSPPRV